MSNKGSRVKICVEYHQVDARLPRKCTQNMPAWSERLTMRKIRFPIAGLMIAVLIIALGLAALRNSSESWAGALFLLTLRRADPRDRRRCLP